MTGSCSSMLSLRSVMSNMKLLAFIVLNVVIGLALVVE